MRLILRLFLCLCSVVCSFGMSEYRCEDIEIPLCQGLQYNRTIMPNLLNQDKQEDAGYDAHQYFPLESVKCSPSVRIFFCSIYAPVCTIINKPIPPCRSLCINVRTGCEPILHSFKFTWPEKFDCQQYPEGGGEELCIGENETSSAPSSTPMYPSIDKTGDDAKRFGFPEGGRDIGFVCPNQLKVPKSLEYSLTIGNKTEYDCGAPCHNMLFSKDKVQAARNWVGVWSLVCLFSCLFTVLTFAIDPERFKYPERPIIFLGVCYLLVAIVYIIGFFSGDSVACRDPFPIEKGTAESTITQGTKHELCTILFMILYFFNMASSVWWVILTLTWFLAAGLKWGHEAIEANSQYFHMIAWGGSALLTIALLALGNVEGDILSGVCYVGVWNVSSLRHFVLLPLTVLLILGIFFLLCGFVSLFRIRTVMKHDGTKTDKLEKLMLRIGVFSVMYMVPAILVIGCLFYEQNYMEQWLVTWQAQVCPQYGIPCPPRNRVLGRRPEFAVFMVKYLMALMVGITSSIWVWSPKTLTIWTKFFHKLRGTRPQAYV